MADRAGHSKPSVTLGIYAHAFKRTDRKAIDRLEALLAPPKKGERIREQTRPRPHIDPNSVKSVYGLIQQENPESLMLSGFLLGAVDGT